MGRVGEAKWLMGLDGVMRGSRILAAGAVRPTSLDLLLVVYG